MARIERTAVVGVVVGSNGVLHGVGVGPDDRVARIHRNGFGTKQTVDHRDVDLRGERDARQSKQGDDRTPKTNAM